MKLEMKLQGERYAEVDWPVVPRCGDKLLLEDDCRYVVTDVCWQGTISKASAVLEVIRVAERPGSEQLEPGLAVDELETDDNHAQKEDEDGDEDSSVEID